MNRVQSLIIPMLMLATVGLVSAADWVAQAGAVPAPAAAAPSSQNGPLPVYRPPLRGAPTMRIGGATRGLEKKLVLSALVPDHIGLTSAAHPLLSWYLSETANASLRVIVQAKSNNARLLDLEFSGPQDAGVHHLRLNEISLVPGIEYEWSVTLAADPVHRTPSQTVQGAIQRIPLLATLGERLSEAKPNEQPAIYAESGLWYDAMTALAELIDAAPADKSLLEQRAALLEQVGLTAAAAHDRKTAFQP
jgi:hypothetical protein